MLGSSDLVAFVAATDLARARSFYEEVLGLTLVEESPFACVFDAHGTTLRVSTVEALAAAPYTVLGWDVDDITSAVASLGGRGVAFEHFDGMGQDDLGVWVTPGGDRVAWFKDPDGNTLSLTQRASSGDAARIGDSVSEVAPPTAQHRLFRAC
jgi:catechol 2,3-dioxygenase-like lactoylglutathione lyase family enzyme